MLSLPGLLSSGVVAPDRLLSMAKMELNYVIIVIYEALCFDVAQGRMNGVPNETRTHSCRFASLAC